MLAQFVAEQARMYGAALARAVAGASPAACASASASAALAPPCGGGGGSMAGRLAAIGLGGGAPSSPTPSPIAGLLARRTPPSGTFDFAMSIDAGALSFENHLCSVDRCGCAPRHRDGCSVNSCR